MIFFQLPWVLGVLIAAVLLFLAVREFLLARRYPHNLPERGMGFFHGFILLGFFVFVLYGMGLLYAHEQKLELIISVFPSARYAPEREAFEDEGTWVFVSSASSETIRSYYVELADQLGYRLAMNVDGATQRLLLSRERDNIFLTIEDRDNVRVLYYSEEGSVRVVEVP